MLIVNKMLMKKILLTFAAALFCAAVFAQSPFAGKMSPSADALKNCPRSGAQDAGNTVGTTVDGQAPRNAATVVTPPEDLQCEDYVLMASGIDDNIISGLLSVGFSGNDVYVQGLCPDMPDSWIKGKVNGNKIMFGRGQFFGKARGVFSMYFEGFDPITKKLCDVVFDYDAEKKTMSTDQVILINDNDETLSPFETLSNAKFLKVNETVGIPSTPHIDRIFVSRIGDPTRLLFTIPLVDTNGNAMDASKLSFIIYSDKHHEMSPCTLKKSDYTAIEEDMTEIPYLYSDNKNIYTCDIDLLMDYSDWTRIGVKAIYKGGGESRQSAVGWHSLEEPDTLPAGVVAKEYMLNVENLDNYNENVFRNAKVAVDGENVYISGLASRFPDTWVKGTVKDNVVTVKGDKYLGEYVVPETREVQHYYFNPEGDVDFEYNHDDEIYTTWTYKVEYAGEANETGLTTCDNYEDAEITLIDDGPKMPEFPKMDSFDMNAWGEYSVSFYVYPYVDEDEFLMTSKLSYELFVDKGDGKETPYEFKSYFYDLDSDMTIIPYGFRSYNGRISHKGEYHTVLLNAYDMATWKRIGVKAIYTGGDETNETPIRWMFIHPGVSGIDEVGTEVADVVYYDMQGRRANAATKGILIKRTRMADGTVKTVKVLNR